MAIKEHRIRFSDKAPSISLLIDGELITSREYKMNNISVVKQTVKQSHPIGQCSSVLLTHYPAVHRQFSGFRLAEALSCFHHTH